MPRLPPGVERRNRRVQTERPPCPRCCTQESKCLGGSGAGRYRYFCNACSIVWSQIPPDGSDRDPRIRISEGKKYICPNCDMPKRGHVCTGTAQALRELAITHTPERIGEQLSDVAHVAEARI